MNRQGFWDVLTWFGKKLNKFAILQNTMNVLGVETYMPSIGCIDLEASLSE